MNLTKADLANILCDKLELNKQNAKNLVDSFFDEISQSLVQGNDVKISGFGSFILKDKSSRPGRNPKTGEEVIISDRRVVTFKRSQKLKDINNKLV